MQSVAQYGRFVVRAIAAGIHNEFQLKSPFDKVKEPLHLVTGTSGFSKSLNKSNQFSKWTFGDDAYFISRNKVADVLGVADGVGGWRNYGIDPSSFPRSLMMACERMVRTGHFVPQSPANIIAAGYSEMLEQKVLTLGSSTACVVSLHREERTIYSANLGDSGFLVIRDGEIVHRSTEQQHYFNTPYQLAVAPPSGDGLWLSDSPEVAETSSFKVQDGDVLMLATDGLFDNLSEDMIVRTLESLHGTNDIDVTYTVAMVLRFHDLMEKIETIGVKNSKEEEKIQSAASSIAEHAYKLSLDPDYMSPFALSACDIGIDMRGGKPDDITCIVARVTHQSDIFL